MTGIKRRLGSMLGPRGITGDQGDQGDRGLPGIDALPADEAVSTYIMEPNTASRAAVESVVDDYTQSELVGSTDFNRLVLGTDRDEYLPPGTIAFYYTPEPVLFTDFSDGTIGAAPDGWTTQWAPQQWTLEEYGGKPVLSITAPAGSGAYGLSWDIIQDVPEFSGDGEIVYKWRSSEGFAVPLRSVVCGSGGVGTETGYYGVIQNSLSSQMNKLDNGARSLIGTSADITNNVGGNISRMRKQGSLLLGKTWLPGDPEPGEWQIESTDTDFTNGWWGLLARGYSSSYQTTIRVDWVGFAAGEHTAPTGDMS